jgi:hypothetical protein
MLYTRNIIVFFSFQLHNLINCSILHLILNSPDPGNTKASNLSDSFSFGKTTVSKEQKPLAYVPVQDERE